jgi:hypothetical protein
MSEQDEDQSPVMLLTASHRLVAELFDDRVRAPSFCLRCLALARGNTSAESVALAEKVLGPHVCEADPRKVTVWIAKDAAGEVRGGIRSSTTEQISVRTPHGWKYVSGHLGIHVSPERAAEASGEMCVRAHHAGLMHCDVDDLHPWPDADGPWRIEVTLAVLEAGDLSDRP